jgi:hypothetical protein
MSDSEARERRRNRLLASKEDRMSKIMSSMSSNTAFNEQEAKSDSPTHSEELRKPSEATSVPMKPSSPKKQQPKKVEETREKLLPKTKDLSQMQQQQQQQQRVTSARPSRFVHVLVVIFAALSVFALNIFSGFNGCKLRIGADLCSAIQNSGYATMISVFCAVEAEEFLFGRLSNTAGSPVDASLLSKDVVLYYFVLLLAFQTQSVFGL